METMTFKKFFESMDLKMEHCQGLVRIVKSNGKVLKSKVGKYYDNYASERDAYDDLEHDLVKAGVLTSV